VTSAPGIGAATYRRWCDLLGLQACDISPVARQAALPVWAIEPMIATPTACDRLRAWTAAGAPDLDARDVGLRLRVRGNRQRAALARDVVSSLPPPTRWCLTSECGVLFFGRDEAGLVLPIMPTEHRLVVIDARLDGASMRDVLTHECAHAWLHSPNVPHDLSDEEAALGVGPDIFHVAARLGIIDEQQTAVLRWEREAATLARAWGADGQAGDAHRCEQLASRRMAREASEY
jgi:hypothetical protein